MTVQQEGMACTEVLVRVKLAVVARARPKAVGRAAATVVAMGEAMVVAMARLMEVEKVKLTVVRMVARQEVGVEMRVAVENVAAVDMVMECAAEPDP